MAPQLLRDGAASGARIAGWARRGDVYAYFNNDWEAFAPRNAQALRRMLATGAAGEAGVAGAAGAAGAAGSAGGAAAAG